MRLFKILKQDIKKTVSNSQEIEGCEPASKPLQKKAKELIARYNLNIGA